MDNRKHVDGCPLSNIRYEFASCGCLHAQAQDEAEALKQRITELEKVIREVGRKAWCNPDSLTCQEIEALVVPLLSENGNG